ncbi:MAG: ABC transporter ATP-binding protein [Streptococcaceae bacterium]|jgi:ABC-2 type transport system ATP-binding protein|nr:ABC transporter ATP-binding protein [Streptococcaceae bacterium]
MLSVLNLTKKYKSTILEDLSVTFPEKTMSIIVGVNGSGKSTLLDCISGIKNFNSGRIQINGFDNDAIEFKSQLFYIPSDFYLPEYMTGAEYISFVLSRYTTSDLFMVHQLIDIFSMTDAKNKLIEGYSFGMKKKIQIIAMIAARTNYVMADEVFSGLDFETTILLKEILAELINKTGIILVSHSLDILRQFPDNVYLMRDGKLEKNTDEIDNLSNIVKGEANIYENIDRFKKSYYSE